MFVSNKPNVLSAILHNLTHDNPLYTLIPRIYTQPYQTYVQLSISLSRNPIPWFITSTSVVHRVNLRGSSCKLPWFIVSTFVVHDVN
ncbi:hypothetical protein HMPREF1199_02012, partial [Hoylesella oralis CC98A]